MLTHSDACSRVPGVRTCGVVWFVDTQPRSRYVQTPGLAHLRRSSTSAMALASNPSPLRRRAFGSAKISTSRLDTRGRRSDLRVEGRVIYRRCPFGLGSCRIGENAQHGTRWKSPEGPTAQLHAQEDELTLNRQWWPALLQPVRTVDAEPLRVSPVGRSRPSVRFPSSLPCHPTRG